jgi:hypothetical protein
VLALERARYSRLGLSVPEAEGLPALAEEVTAAMRASAPTRAGRRAEWLPASLWRRSSRGPAAPAVDEEVVRDRVSV